MRSVPSISHTRICAIILHIELGLLDPKFNLEYSVLYGYMLTMFNVSVWLPPPALSVDADILEHSHPRAPWQPHHLCLPLLY